VLDSADCAGVPFGHQAQPVSARQENCRQGCHLDAEDNLGHDLHKAASRAVTVLGDVGKIGLNPPSDLVPGHGLVRFDHVPGEAGIRGEELVVHLPDRGHAERVRHED
jgi:hypothetical protein